MREIKIDRPGFSISRGLEILEQSLGLGVILHLQRDRRDAEFEIARRFIFVPQFLHHLPRIAIALLLDVKLRERADRRLRIGLRIDELLQVFDRRIRRALADHLGLEQRCAVPVGAKLERLFRFLDHRRCDRDIVGARVQRRQRNGEVRFRARRIRLRQFANQPKHGLLVRLLREQAIDLQKRVADAAAGHRGIGKKPRQPKLEIFIAARFNRIAVAAVRERGENLLRTLRGRIERRPQLRRFLCQRALPARQRNFRCAFCDARVVRLTRRVKISARCDGGVATLQRDVAQQQSIEQIRRQAFAGFARVRSIVGGWRRSFGDDGAGKCARNDDDAAGAKQNGWTGHENANSEKWPKTA